MSEVKVTSETVGQPTVSTETVAMTETVKKPKKVHAAKKENAEAPKVIEPKVEKKAKKLNCKKLYESLVVRSNELSDNFVWKVGSREIGLKAAFVETALSFIGCKDLSTTILSVSRDKFLNHFCELVKVQPNASKRINKNENKSVSTYGKVVIDTVDQFDVDGENYLILGFLKYPVVITENWVLVKSGINLVIMKPELFGLIKAGTMLDDLAVTII